MRQILIMDITENMAQWLTCSLMMQDVKQETHEIHISTGCA